MVAPSIEQSKPTTITPAASSSTISSQRVKTLLESPIDWQWKPPSGFAEIAKSLWGDNSPSITVEVPPELTTPQGLLVGTAMATMVSMRLHQVSGTIYLDMVTTSMSLVGLGATPMVVDHPMPTLEVVKTQSLTNPHSPPLIASFYWQLLTLDPCWTVFLSVLTWVCCIKYLLEVFYQS